MNSCSRILRLRNLVSGSNLKNVKPLIISSSAKNNFSSLCPQSRICESQLMKLSKPFASSRLYSQANQLKFDREPVQPHPQIWVLERAVSIGLLVSIPAAFAYVEFNDLECVLDILIALHVHWGLEAIFKDYLRPVIVGNTIPKFCDVYAALISVYIAVSLLWISLHGDGIGKTVRKIWYLNPNVE